MGEIDKESVGEICKKIQDLLHVGNYKNALALIRSLESYVTMMNEIKKENNKQIPSINLDYR